MQHIVSCRICMMKGPFRELKLERNAARRVMTVCRTSMLSTLISSATRGSSFATSRTRSQTLSPPGTTPDTSILRRMEVLIALRVRQSMVQISRNGRLPGNRPATSANLCSISETSRMPREENIGAEANGDGCSHMDFSCRSSSEGWRRATLGG